MALEVSCPLSEHARPRTRVEVTMVERADGVLRLARVAAIIAADRERQAKGLAA
jgi:hypothetical protein